MNSALSFLHRHPSLWPAALFILFLPLLLAVSRSRSLSALLERLESRLLWLWSLVGIGIFAFCDLAYITCPAFFDFFEPCGASVAYTVFHGGNAYPDITSAERYCLPYGPILYLAMGSSQWLLGASTFSSKLPACLAAALSIGLFWRVQLRRGLPAIAACAIVALTATSLLALRGTVFWAKSDPLIFLSVMTGIWTAFRRGWPSSILLGACIGLAMGLKVTAAAYFLPVLVIAFCAGWRWRDFAICGGVLLLVLLLPFLLLPRQFPWRNYLAFFHVVGREGFGVGPAIGFVKWAAMMAGLVFVSDHFIHQSMTPQSRRRRWTYRAALACGMALTSIPASTVLTGPHHLMPFVPLTLLSFGNVFDRNETLAWHYSKKPVWRAAAYAIFAGCALVAIQTASQFVRARSEIDGQARACEADLRQFLTHHPQSTILIGTAIGDESRLPARLRHQLVFAGNPIGLDAAVVSDYQMGGVAEPDLPSFLEEMHFRDPRHVLWLFPRGSAPFTSTNFYDPLRPIYPEQFRRDFSDRFEQRETTAFFDLYFPIKEQ